MCNVKPFVFHGLSSPFYGMMDIEFWEDYLKAAKAADLPGKDSFMYLIEFQSRIAHKLYELLAVEPRPIEDAALGTAACFATTYIKEMVIVPLPDVIRGPLKKLSKLPVERRADLLLTYLIHHRPSDPDDATNLIIKTLAIPVAAICYSVERPDVPLRGPTGCKNIEMKPREKLQACNVKPGCLACGAPPLYATKSGYVCSICFSRWDDGFKHCPYCKEIIDIGNRLIKCVGCGVAIPYIADDNFPELLFSSFDVEGKRVSYSLAEEWKNLVGKVRI